MKNNRLTNEEIGKIRIAIEEIKKLSSMENCAFKNDETIPLARLKSWLMWFDVYANQIEDILTSTSTRKSFYP